MSDIKVVTEEELQQVRDLQDSYMKVTFEIGQLSVEKKELEDKIKQVQEKEQKAFQEHTTLRQKEQELSNILQGKYGSSTIDLETGAIS